MTGFVALGMFLIGCGCGVLIGLMAGHGLKLDPSSRIWKVTTVHVAPKKAAASKSPTPPTMPDQFLPGPSSSYYWQSTTPAPKKRTKKSAPKIRKGAKKK